jgi:hypothetical protein
MADFDYTITEREKKEIQAKKDKIKYMKIMFSRWILQNGDISNNINSYLIHWKPKQLVNLMDTKYRKIRNIFKTFIHTTSISSCQLRIPITDLYKADSKVYKLWKRANDKTIGNNGSKSQRKNTKDWKSIKECVDYIVKKHLAIRNLNGCQLYELEYDYYNSLNDDEYNSLRDICEEIDGYEDWSITKINKLKNIIKKVNDVDESGVQYKIYRRGYYYLWEHRNIIELEKELNVDAYFLLKELQLKNDFKHPNNFYQKCYNLADYHTMYCNKIRSSSNYGCLWDTECFKNNNIRDMVLDVICKKRFNGDCETTTNMNITDTFHNIKKMFKFDEKMKVKMCEAYRKNLLELEKNKNRCWIEDEKINSTREANVYNL